MKILQIIPRFNPSLGGGVDVVYHISKYLVLRGHKVTILTTNYKFDEEYADSIRKIGVKVVPFKHHFNFCLFIPSPDMKTWLKKNIQQYEIIHLNGTRSYQNNVVMDLALKYNIPYILQAHGSIMRIVERKKFKFLYDLVWGNRLIENASKFIALSNSEADTHEMMGIDRSKIVIIPNGVDLTRFHNLPEKGEFRDKYSLQKERIILYLGRLHRSKGLDLLIEAFLEVTQKNDYVTLVLVGPDGGFKQSLIKKIEELHVEKKVIFTGLVSEEEKYSAFIDADVFVTPKFYGFPITFVEACACGCPIITTNGGDYLDWIDGKAGFSTVFNKSDVADAICKILRNDNLRLEMSANCIYLVKEKFNWESISEKVEGVYAQI